MNKLFKAGIVTTGLFLLVENVDSYRYMKVGLRRYNGNREKAEMFAICDDQTLPEYWLTWPERKAAEIAYRFK